MTDDLAYHLAREYHAKVLAYLGGREAGPVEERQIRVVRNAVVELGEKLGVSQSSLAEAMERVSGNSKAGG